MIERMEKFLQYIVDRVRFKDAIFISFDEHGSFDLVAMEHMGRKEIQDLLVQAVKSMNNPTLSIEDYEALLPEFESGAKDIRDYNVLVKRETT